MPTRPRLVRSIPFWTLVAASVATALAGAAILVDKLGTMTTTLTDGSATGVDVYVGQSVAVVGAILLGTGIVGVLISLAVAAASTLRSVPPVEVVEPIDWDADDVVDAQDLAVEGDSGHGYERGLGYTAAVDTATEPSADAEEAEREASAATR